MAMMAPMANVWATRRGPYPGTIPTVANGGKGIPRALPGAIGQAHPPAPGAPTTMLPGQTQAPQNGFYNGITPQPATLGPAQQVPMNITPPPSGGITTPAGMNAPQARADPNATTLNGLNGPTPGMPPMAAINAPALSGAASPYLQAVQQSLQPYFDQQQESLKAQLAAQGILPSGAGNQGLQDLTAMQNAQVSGAVAPLIQQGFGQQFSAAQGNASAYNQALAQMLQEQFGAQQTNAQLGMQGQEFNANLLNNAIMQNTGYNNQALMAGAGYGNSDYLNALAQMGGLNSQNLGYLNSILSGGMNNQVNSYMGGQNLGAGYAAQIGQNQGYGTPGTSGPFGNGSVNTGGYFPTYPSSSSSSSVPYANSDGTPQGNVFDPSATLSSP